MFPKPAFRKTDTLGTKKDISPSNQSNRHEYSLRTFKSKRGGGKSAGLFAVRKLALKLLQLKSSLPFSSTRTFASAVTVLGYVRAHQSLEVGQESPVSHLLQLLDEVPHLDVLGVQRPSIGLQGIHDLGEPLVNCVDTLVGLHSSGLIGSNHLIFLRV